MASPQRRDEQRLDRVQPILRLLERDVRSDSKTSLVTSSRSSCRTAPAICLRASSRSRGTGERQCMNFTPDCRWPRSASL
jgi:hypothetical protein